MGTPSAEEKLQERRGTPASGAGPFARPPHTHAAPPPASRHRLIRSVWLCVHACVRGERRRGKGGGAQRRDRSGAVTVGLHRVAPLCARRRAARAPPQRACPPHAHSVQASEAARARGLRAALAGGVCCAPLGPTAQRRGRHGRALPPSLRPARPRMSHLRAAAAAAQRPACARVAGGEGSCCVTGEKQMSRSQWRSPAPCQDHAAGRYGGTLGAGIGGRRGCCVDGAAGRRG